MKRNSNLIIAILWAGIALQEFTNEEWIFLLALLIQILSMVQTYLEGKKDD